MVDELKKNGVHIEKTQGIQKEIDAIISLARKNKPKYAEIKTLILTLSVNVRGTFNNREMSLVNTKLQEASHWCDEKPNDQIVQKLIEARNWAGEYIEVLS